jgi:phosphate-selective porin OprO/OprP
VSQTRRLIPVAAILLTFAVSIPTQAEENAAAESLAVANPVQPSPGLKSAPRELKAKAKKSAPLPAPRWFQYGSKGLELGSNERAFSGRVNVRSQLRFSAPFTSPPRKSSHFDREDDNDMRFRRARFKMEGHVGKSWIQYKYEHDLVQGKLLDLRFDVGPEWLKLRVGQWKADYSRERMDSSGKQQFAERSIVNRAFTLDRQKGAMAVGRLGKGTALDTQYFAGVFTGQGRGVFRDRRIPTDATDGSPLWVLRYQWNPLGGGVGLSQSDLEKLRKPRLSLAVATAGNRSSYTRFSSSGGGQLDGFQAGLPGQYSLRQQLEETTFKYRGLSVQHEWHWKRIVDRVNQSRTHMRGSYLQTGYFFNEIYSKIPKQLELAGRLAFVDPDTARGGDVIRETGVAVNWFFKGHADKLTVDVGRYGLLQASGVRRSTFGVRAQWDVSF